MGIAWIGNVSVLLVSRGKHVSMLIVLVSVRFTGNVLSRLRMSLFVVANLGGVGMIVRRRGEGGWLE